VYWRRNGLELVGKGDSDGGSVGIDFRDCALYPSILPLDGIWATAPYLHNGSVPTLYHLLTGDRPSTFYRGNYAYDSENVGFVWDRAVDVDRAVLYDTSKSGYGNTGHIGLTYSGGIDWNEDPDALWDLLEYLKTL
jgi:hypothetical protein